MRDISRNIGSVTRRSLIGSTAVAAGGALLTLPAIPRRTVAATSATAGYMQVLPYGGRAVGAAVLNGQVGNLPCQNIAGSGGLQFQQVQLQSTDPIVAVSVAEPLRFLPAGLDRWRLFGQDQGKGKATGIVRPALRGDTTTTVDVLDLPYGGDIKIVVCKITSTSTAAVEPGPVAGETAVIENCARAASWQAEWVKSGGTGAAPLDFAKYPTIWFTKPVDPVVQGWQIGDRIGFGVVNSAPYSASSEMAPTSRWATFNHCFSRDRPDVARSSFIYDMDVGAYRQSNDISGLGDPSGYETEYFPVLLVGHRQPTGRMIVKGNSLAQYSGTKDRLSLSSNVRYRQIIRIPNNSAYAGKTVRQVDTALFCSTSTINGTVVMQLNAGGRRQEGNTTMEPFSRKLRSRLRVTSS